LKTKLAAKERVLDSHKQLQIQATIDDLILREEANNRTIDDLTNTEKSNKLIIQDLREELTVVKGKISALTLSEEENKAVIKQLLENEKQFQATIDNLIITEESNKLIIQDLDGERYVSGCYIVQILSHGHRYCRPMGCE
jgi:hypothetical protein